MTGPARLAVGAAAGALLAGAVGGPVGLAVASAGVAAWVGLRARLGPLLARSGPLVIGAAVVCIRVALAGPPPAPPSLPAGSGPWVAIVETVGSPRAGARPAVISVPSVPGLRLAATLPWYPEVAPGDAVRIEGTPEAPPPEGDYATYLDRVGAAGTIRARTLALLPDGGARGGPTWEALRSAAADGLERALPEPEAGLADGILVGLRDRVDRDLAAAFTTAGVSHVVAISGWNIAIVATTLGAVTGRLGRRRRTIATGLAIAGYVAFVGPSPSVVRAGAMAGCALMARELGRPASAISAMGLAVTGLLVLDPATVDDPGFRLSVLATAGLITWGTALSRRLAGRAPGPARAWLAESLGVSLAAQAATLPVILLDFGRLSIVSPAVNLVVAPLVAPAMAAGAVALLAGLLVVAGAPPTLATLAGLPAWALLGALVAVVRLGAGLPFASIGLEEPASVVAAATSAATILVVANLGGRAAWPRPPVRSRRVQPRRERGSDRRAFADRRRRLLGLLLGAATVAVGLAAAHRPDGSTKITVLDVGQGDAILVEGSAGTHLLVDGGPDPGRLLVALGERLPPWDRRIDVLVLTHPHEDHVAGLASVLERFEVGRVFEPGMRGPGPGYAAWDAALGSHGERAPPRGILRTGDRLTIDDVRLRVLWPDEGRVPDHPADGGTAINNVSIVLLGEVGGHRFLLTGDAERDVEATLVERGLPTVDFLKVAHHGSDTSSTAPLLAMVHPQVAAISVGAGNPYGHPDPEALARLQRFAGRVVRTDLDGSVTVAFDTSGIHVGTTGGRHGAAGGSRAGLATEPGYHRPDDGSLPGGGGAPAPVPRPARLARASLAGRRGGRRLARASRRAPDVGRRDVGLPRRDRSGARRGGRAPPRRR